MLLADKVAIVTGGAKGIGRAVARRLAKEGAKVVIADVSDEDGASVVSEIEMAGGAAVYKSANIAERLDVHNLVAMADDAFNRLDLLVNNAAVIDDSGFLDLEEAEFDRVMQTNLKGAFLISQSVARQFVRQRERDPDAPPGVIVNVTSMGAHFGLAEHVAYSVSKGGLAQLTKSMALALAPHGVRVNAVAPGSVETELLESVLDTDDLVSSAISRTPLGRFGRPDEIAAIVAWLASDQASYLTGTTIWADGGRTALNLEMPSAPVDS